MLAGVTYEEITDKGLVITDNDGKRRTLETATIITSLPLLPNLELAKTLDGSVPEVYTIGDAREPNMIIDAVGDGSRIAHAL